MAFQQRIVKLDPIEGKWGNVKVKLLDTSSNAVGDFYGLFLFLEEYIHLTHSTIQFKKGELACLLISGEYKANFIADV